MVESTDLSIGQVTTTEPCPMCGWTPRTDAESSFRFLFDYWRGLIYTSDGIRIWLSPSQADLLQIFLDAWPELVTRSNLESRLYGASYHEQRKVRIRPPIVFALYRFRQRLRPLGLYVRNVPGRGWWLSREKGGKPPS